MAYDWAVTAKVTQIEASYIPGSIPFHIDTPAGNCTTDLPLVWQPQGGDAVMRAQNSQGVLAVLLTAKATGQSILVLGDNNGCTVDYVYIK